MLRVSQPAMGGIVSIALELEALNRRVRGPEFRSSADQFLERRARRVRLELPRIAATVRATFPPEARVLTLSRSETVLRSLRTLPVGTRPQEVVVLRSRPGGEGAHTAASLRSFGIRARTVEDDRAKEFVPDSDLLLIGVDGVFLDADVTHKIGTRGLARLSREAHVPVAAVTGLSKLARESAPRGAALRGTFDVTPGSWIGTFWTDEGPLSPGDIGRRLRSGNR